MAEKEDIIFQLKVEGSDALTEMEKFKKSIIQTKQEQQELTKAYKQGNITLDEFVQEQVRLESILKKQQSSYNNVQKSVTGVKTQLDKLIDSNKKISKSFEDTAKEIKVAGFSMNDLTTKMASFANPATAAVGIVTALGAAYANSTVGAKDLEFATNQLGAAFNILNNNLAETISSGEDGKGFFSTLLDNIMSTYIPGIGGISKFVAKTKTDLKNLEIEELDAKRAAKDALNEAEELRRTRDREDLTLKDRLAAAHDVQLFIDKREQELVGVQQKRLEALNTLFSLDKHNLELKKAIKIVEFEIADIQEDSEGKRTEALNGIIKLEKELLKVRDAVGGRKMTMAVPKGTEADERQAQTDIQDFILGYQINQADREIQLEQQTEAEKTAIEKREAAKRVAAAQAESDAKVVAATTVLDSVANLAEEGSELQKAASLLSIAVSSSEAITKGIAASQSVPFPGNLVAMASTTAAILGAIANAKSVFGFAEGGWTGPGSKYQPVGIVHADEYVTPKHIVHSAAAQPHLAALESMRLRGYADGGLVTNSLTSGVNQNMAIANMLKMMPVPEVSVREITKAANRVRVKEGLK